MTVAAMGAVSCEKFLDVMPDNRTELDTQGKIQSLLLMIFSTGILLLGISPASTGFAPA